MNDNSQAIIQPISGDSSTKKEAKSIHQPVTYFRFYQTLQTNVIFSLIRFTSDCSG